MEERFVVPVLLLNGQREVQGVQLLAGKDMMNVTGAIEQDTGLEIVRTIVTMVSVDLVAGVGEVEVEVAVADTDPLHPEGGGGHVQDPVIGRRGLAADRGVVKEEDQDQAVVNVALKREEKVNLAVNRVPKAKVDLKRTVDPEVDHLRRMM